MYDDDGDHYRAVLKLWIADACSTYAKQLKELSLHCLIIIVFHGNVECVQSRNKSFTLLFVQICLRNENHANQIPG